MSPPLVFIVGGTGAQGIPIVKSLVEDGSYSVRILTRDTSSKRAMELQALSPSNVSLVSGTFFSEDDLRAGFHGADYAFINIDGFNSGEKAEIFWTMRAYELALEEGVKFYVHGNLDFVYKKSGYKPEFRTGHYDGKGRAGEWILDQAKHNTQMGAALFTTGPYIQMAISKNTPFQPVVEDGVVIWRVPIGQGAAAHVDLDDCGHYVRWMLDNQTQSNGKDLEVAIDMINYDDMAKAFTKVTGKPARYEPVDLDTWWKTGPMARAAGFSSGYGVALDDPSAVTIRENFTGFLKMWEASVGNKGLIQRDFDLLDKIHPTRTKSAEEWLRKEEKRGVEAGLGSLWERVNDLKLLLKNQEDGSRFREETSSKI
ncbi:NAD(P)-binding protein [Microthyrium microscopicum]|uniref:NAD(P)-binding protein n=1 Tax=Microthyrium microscopicum TaxID=703497 RepID=A0A6A6UNE6_9PEZI|nr:NAD(P)-binding protein [Microthyrium microscopicum]